MIASPFQSASRPLRRIPALSTFSLEIIPQSPLPLYKKRLFFGLDLHGLHRFSDSTNVAFVLFYLKTAKFPDSTRSPRNRHRMESKNITNTRCFYGLKFWYFLQELISSLCSSHLPEFSIPSMIKH
jgi:hypothetical protein